jgi:hypothetical protein
MPPDRGRLVESESDAAKWARWGAIAIAAWAVLSGPVLAAMFREMFDFFHELADLPMGATVDFEESFPQTTGSGSILLLQLGGLVQIASIIAWVVWQHRANTAALALRLPLTRSPAWGVAGWFIPVVNLWFPYEAARDNLPAGDPNRPAVLRWWLGYLGLNVVLWAIVIGWFAAGAALGVPLLAVGAAYGWWWATAAGQVVTSTESVHRRLAGLRAEA